ncbi:MAG: hypothetical protein PHU08_02625 [Dehalococcoidales bacterium]|nr:hypothetical protein [Dehalococcoidales bacterium]
MSYDRETLIHKADELEKRCKYEQAAEIYLTLLKEKPDDVAILLKAAHSIYWGDDWGPIEEKMEKNIAKMFELLVKAVNLEPRNPTPRYCLARYMMLYGNGDVEYAIAAAKEIRKILEIEPANLSSLLILGMDYHLMKAGITIEEVISLYQKATANNQDDYRIWGSIGDFIYHNIASRWTKSVTKMASDHRYIRQMLSAYENMKARMSSEEHDQRKVYVDGRIKKCREMLSKVERYRKSLQKKIDEARDDPNLDVRPLLSFIEYHILEWQVWEPEPSYLVYTWTKRDTGASPVTIMKGMVNLVKLGFSWSYDVNSIPYQKVTLKDLKKDLAHSDRYMMNHYYNSEYYFKITEKGEKELTKKIYDTYTKL